ncbi:hypothetical protein QWZ08_19465 [Ferruginibacter paludis]|uniref:hypothetical protein n=1 Tax=Ferruginibacter paludis TaxID=1310417 RepID=UPI0025B2A1C8|nr:hypothetical protein [Ferruginibacter paludis]MDN3657840.1 hypothetical protein [Ferruginibacter paludis]
MNNNLTLKFLYTLVAVSFVNLKTNAQSFSDHNNKTLFNILPQKNFSYDVGGTSADISWLFARHKKYIYYVGPQPKTMITDITTKPDNATNYTTADNSLVFVTGSISNVNSAYKSFFSNLNQPTVSLAVAYAFNNALWMNWDKLKRLKQWNGYLKFFVNNTVSAYYDVVNKDSIAAKKLPLLNFGAELNYTNFATPILWLNFNLSTTVGMPVDTLNSYQNSIAIPISLSNPTVVPIGEGAGKYGGALSKNQVNYRLAFTPSLFFREGSKICAFPFYEMYGSSSKIWTHLVGGAIGILGSKFDPAKAAISPVLEVGIDWNSNAPTHNRWSGANFIISFKGTFGGS